jgi:hypothetical protein
MLPTIREQWKTHYCFSRNKWYSPEYENIYHQLASLDTDTATPEDVAAIIGNGTWVSIQKCTECTDIAVVRVGDDDDDYESETVYLCRSCVKKVYDLVYNEGHDHE